MPDRVLRDTVSTVPLDAVPQAAERLLAGKVRGRVVVELASGRA